MKLRFPPADADARWRARRHWSPPAKRWWTALPARRDRGGGKPAFRRLLHCVAALWVPPPLIAAPLRSFLAAHPRSHGGILVKARFSCSLPLCILQVRAGIMARRVCSPVQAHIRSLLLAAAPRSRFRRARLRRAGPVFSVGILGHWGCRSVHLDQLGLIGPADRILIVRRALGQLPRSPRRGLRTSIRR